MSQWNGHIKALNLNSKKIFTGVLSFLFGAALFCGLLKIADLAVAGLFGPAPSLYLSKSMVTFTMLPYTFGHMPAYFSEKGVQSGFMGFWETRDLFSEKKVDEIRIHLIGGSGAQGQGDYYPNEYMLYKRLEKYLSLLQKDSSSQITVFNTAMGGSTTLWNFYDRIFYLNKAPVDTVLSYSGFNDVSMLWHYQYDPINLTYYLNRLANEKNVENQSERIIRNYSNKKQYFNDSVLPTYLKALELLADTLEVPLVVASQCVESNPNEWKEFSGGIDGCLGESFYNDMFSKIKELTTKRNDMIFIDSAGHFSGSRDLFGLHLTLVAQDQVARFIAFELSKKIPKIRNACKNFESFEEFEYFIHSYHKSTNKKEFNENYYLTLYPDIKQGIQKKVFQSGWDHWLQAGRSEDRIPN